ALLLVLVTVACIGESRANSFSSVAEYEQEVDDASEDVLVRNLATKQISKVSQNSIDGNLSKEVLDEEPGDDESDCDGDEAVEEIVDEMPPKGVLSLTTGDVEVKFQVKYKPESFYARNANMLNSNNESDSIYFSRATLDINVGLGYGKDFFGHNAVNFF